MRIVIEIDGLPVADTTVANTTVADTTATPRTGPAVTAGVGRPPAEPAAGAVVEAVDAGPATLPAELLATVGTRWEPAVAEGVAMADAVDAGPAPVLTDRDEHRGTDADDGTQEQSVPPPG